MLTLLYSERSSEVPLSSLKLLCEEFKYLSHYAASFTDSSNGDGVQRLNVILDSVFVHVLEAHNDLLDQEALLRCTNFLTGASEVSPVRAGGTTEIRLKLHDNLQGSSFECVVSQYFNPALEALHSAQDQHLAGRRRDALASSAVAWVNFFAGCLVLYVPDRVVDPASRLLIKRNRHRKRKRELQTKLDALVIYEKTSTGGSTNLRCHDMQQKLSILGDEPLVPAVARPLVSQINDLQIVFKSILQSVVDKLPNGQTLQSFISGDASRKPIVDLIRSNIAPLIEQLNSKHRVYEDITGVVVALLQGLDVGLALSLLVHSCTGTQNPEAAAICGLTPFLGLKPDSSVCKRLENQDAGDDKSRLIRLQLFSIVNTTDCTWKRSLAHTACKVFHSFYEQWKERLSEDQRENAARSSLYRYRGITENGHEDLDSLEDLFIDSDILDVEEASHYSPRVLSQTLAGLQRDIFGTNQATSDLILGLLRNASNSLAALPDHEFSVCPTEQLLPALILALDEQQKGLHNAPTNQHDYNFYTDGNPREAQELVTVVQRLQARFFGLLQAWPEHATIIDVLRTSRELLVTSRGTPLARLLTKTEQLHGFVYEWQVVASSEYSVATSYDQLTNMILRWRRLELSTWARLLDMEHRKCRDDVDAWWFVTYEVIVAVPMSLIVAGQDLRQHTEHLIATLIEEIRTTSLGLFKLRLQSIGCFVGHVELLSRNFHEMHTISNALRNFLSFYQRYASSVEESIQKGRQSLERELKEILLLASWKDTNISALRDSAKRSHHKLFKVVRKYRALLAQPAEQELQRWIPGNTDTIPGQVLPAIATKFVDISALRICRESLPGWTTKPLRFRHPGIAVDTMTRMGALPPFAIGSATHLYEYTAELVGNIETLKSETPLSLNKGNAGLIKYLKTRKRKLLTDTLKDLRQMGLKWNIASDVLTQQAFLSGILVSCPANSIVETADNMSVAESYLNQVLDHLPQIRNQQISQDLSHEEMTRSVGYLESCLSILLRQRATLAFSFAELDSINEVVDLMQNLGTSDAHNIEKVSERCKYERRQVFDRIEWLQALLDTGCTLLEKYGALGVIDTTAVIESFKAWKQKIGGVVAAEKSLPILPQGLGSTRHMQTYRQAKHLLGELRNYLVACAQEHPKLSFLPQHVELWTVFTNEEGFVKREDGDSSDGLSNHEDSGGDELQLQSSQDAKAGTPKRSIGLADLDDQITRGLNLILVAMQRFQTAVPTLPNSAKESSWMVQTDRTLSGLLKSMSSGTVAELFCHAMDQIQNLDSEDGQEIKVAGAAFGIALPIVSKFRDIQRELLYRYAELHRALCNLASMLARSLSIIKSQGFCNPADSSTSNNEENGKVESGTGLSQGEGAEDISKDIQEDEDLSELAQQGDQRGNEGDIESQDDAVDMDHDELQGEMGDASGTDGEAESSHDDRDDLDEEVGDVDELDPGAVNEKLWDGDNESSNEDKEGFGGKSKAQKEHQAALEGERGPRDFEDEEETAAEENSSSADELEKENEAVRGETDQLDSHLSREQNLDLPEDMDIDGQSSISELQGSDLDGSLEDEDDDDVDGEESILEGGEKNVKSEDSEEEEYPLERESSEKGHENIDEKAAETLGADSPVDTEPDQDIADEDQKALHDHLDYASSGLHDFAASEMEGGCQDDQHQEREENTENAGAHGREGDTHGSSRQNEAEVSVKQGEGEQVAGKSDEAEDHDATASETLRDQAFKKLGDVLDKWHRQRRQIQNASAKESQPKGNNPESMAREFEHLQDEDAEGDTQALGAASEEQVHALDQRGLDTEMTEPQDDFLADDLESDAIGDYDQNKDDLEALQSSVHEHKEQAAIGSFIANNDRSEPLTQDLEVPDPVEEDQTMSVDENPPPNPEVTPSNTLSTRSATESCRLWSHCETVTHTLSLILTEQLRLILTPTQATRMRGDFRTGKRLNIKRIIPYIASNYKRDKIWMRRSTPQKRNYQIMLAVDDSKSMGASASGHLAFEALVLVTKSLTMLEAGEICVVGFGEDVQVAHAFDQPFSAEAGVGIIQQLGFQQTKTNVRKLVAESITLFREARAKTSSSSAAAGELWQLLLIISDGLCEDHEAIRRLVRQAQQERIMIVFVIVDAVRGESIVDMSQAVFEPDPDSDGGGQKLKIKRYLEGFPFMYYLVVTDVKDLPGVLATALRQWFSEVVGQGD